MTRIMRVINVINDWCDCDKIINTVPLPATCRCGTKHPHTHCVKCGKVVEVLLSDGTRQRCDDYDKEKRIK